MEDTQPSVAMLGTAEPSAAALAPELERTGGSVEVNVETETKVVNHLNTALPSTAALIKLGAAPMDHADNDIQDAAVKVANIVKVKVDLHDFRMCDAATLLRRTIVASSGIAGMTNAQRRDVAIQSAVNIVSAQTHLTEDEKFVISATISALAPALIELMEDVSKGVVKLFKKNIKWCCK
jgi:hypothetical protein